MKNEKPQSIKYHGFAIHLKLLPSKIITKPIINFFPNNRKKLLEAIVIIYRTLQRKINMFSYKKTSDEKSKISSYKKNKSKRTKKEQHYTLYIFHNSRTQ